MTDDIDKKIKELTKLKLEESEKNLEKESDNKKKKEHAKKQKEKLFSEAYTFFKRIISKFEIIETDVIERFDDERFDDEQKEVKGYRINWDDSLDQLKYISYLHLTKTEFVFIWNKIKGVGDVNLTKEYRFSVDQTYENKFCCKILRRGIKRELNENDKKRKSLEDRIVVAQETYDRRLRSYRGDADDFMSKSQRPSKTRLTQLINDLYEYYFEDKHFDSKNEFIDHAFSKLTDSMTDEEVIKYFKKL